jgi:hypothetical protein
MKGLKRFKLWVFVLLFSMTGTVIAQLDNEVASAASINISDKKITLEVGQSKTLHVIGAKNNAKWSSKDKSIAQVNKNGKVTAIKVGKTIITLVVSKKKFTCKVTVIEANKDNPYIADAPFDAVEAKIGDYNFVISKNWTITDSDSAIVFIVPVSSVDAKDSSSVQLDIEYTGKKVTTYSDLKDYMDDNLPQSFITSTYTENLINSGMIAKDTQVVYTDYITSEFEVPLGTAYKIEFNMSYNGVHRSEAIYYLGTNNYFIAINTDDLEESTTPDAKTVGEYILTSLQLK